MQNFSFTPYAMVISFWRNRLLIGSLVKRDILGRYRGSSMGILWSLLNPILMLVIYTFVFSVVFRARWSGGSESKMEFALILFAGLIVFNIFAECFNRAPGLILANVNYVKKVIFPLEILPWVSLGAALFHALISFIVWLFFYVCFFGLPPITLLLLPITLLPLIFLCLGVSWFFSSLGVFIRDVGQVAALAITVLMFLSPIFYPVSALPQEYQILLTLNPLTLEIEMVRDILIWGKCPSIPSYLFYLLVNISIAYFGFFWFQKTRKGFSDVI